MEPYQRNQSLRSVRLPRPTRLDFQMAGGKKKESLSFPALRHRSSHMAKESGGDVCCLGGRGRNNPRGEEKMSERCQGSLHQAGKDLPVRGRRTMKLDLSVHHRQRHDMSSTAPPYHRA